MGAPRCCETAPRGAYYPCASETAARPCGGVFSLLLRTLAGSFRLGP